MVARPTLPNLDTLPPEALKALILAQHRTLAVQAEEIRAQRERLHSQDEQLAGRQGEIERLQLLIAKLRRMQFGRRSEKLDRQIEQLELQLDELATASAAAPTPGATAPAARGESRRDGRCRVICRVRSGRFCPRKRALRQTRARPLLESLHEWLESCLTKLSQKSDTTAAVKYGERYVKRILPTYAGV